MILDIFDIKLILVYIYIYMKLNSYFKYKVTGFVICQITTTKRELDRMKKGSFSSNQLSKYVTSSFDLYGVYVHTHASQ